MYAVYDRWLGNKREKARERPPTILISGSATWTLKQSNASMDALDEYRRNVSGVAGLMDRLTKLGTQVKSLPWFLPWFLPSFPHSSPRSRRGECLPKFAALCREWDSMD